jgi:hypothetical protein
MDSQRIARIFGILFLITFITSIAALALFQSVLDDPAGYIAGGGKANQIYPGAFLEFLLILANVGTAVVLSTNTTARWERESREGPQQLPSTRRTVSVDGFPGRALGPLGSCRARPGLR